MACGILAETRDGIEIHQVFSAESEDCCKSLCVCEHVRFASQLPARPTIQTKREESKGDSEKKLGQTMRFRHSEESEASGSCL